MAHKNSHIDTAISLTLVLVATLLTYLLSNWEIWETTLTSYLSYKWAVQLFTISLLLLFLFLLFLLSGKPSIDRRLKNKEIPVFIETIENIVSSEYRLHQINKLEGKIEDAVEKEANKGFSLPQGSLNGALSEIFLREIEVFSKMLQTAISKAIVKVDKNNILSQIESTIENLLLQHKKDVLKTYMDYVHSYFSDEPFENFYSISEKSFLSVANAETEQRIKNIKSLVKLKIFA